MDQSRRSFIKNSAFALAGATLLSDKLLTFSPAKERVVLQLYSIREAMKADAKGTLRKLAKAGYRNIEHANYIERKFYGYTVSEFKAILKDLGLQMPSGHTYRNDGTALG